MGGDRLISKAECENCQKYLCEKIDSLRRELRVGIVAVGIFISILGVLIKTGLI